MKQAETWLALEAECPYCGQIHQPEQVDEHEDELSEWYCDKCQQEFTYCHPENQYGLAK